MYLTAIIDWHSRYIVGWELDDTLDTRACIEACKRAFKVAKPVIINSDHGNQFTSTDYKGFLKENRVKQNMDGKSRWADNILIERWFHTFKYDEVYLIEWRNIKGARAAIKKYIHRYNFEICHSAIGYIIFKKIYQSFSLFIYAEKKQAEISAINGKYLAGPLGDRNTELFGEINLFLTKSMATSVSHIHHQSEFYVYINRQLRINNEVKSVIAGLNALDILQRKQRRIEERKRI